MTQPRFFGYGSLVNTATHTYPNARPARLEGWRRMWRHTTLRDVAYLTIVPDQTCHLDGLIADVPNADWAALDLREASYDRITPDAGALTAQGTALKGVELYCTRSDRDTAPSVRHPILLSYLDVVVQGYLNVFGTQGVERFFDTTSGWDAPILDDRAAPIYPRHQQLTLADTALVDRHLAALPTHMQQLHQPGLSGKWL